MEMNNVDLTFKLKSDFSVNFSSVLHRKFQDDPTRDSHCGTLWDSSLLLHHAKGHRLGTRKLQLGPNMLNQLNK